MPSLVGARSGDLAGASKQNACSFLQVETSFEGVLCQLATVKAQLHPQVLPSCQAES